MTRAELAALLQSHPNTILRWQREEGFPIAVRGRGRPSRYEIAQVQAWLKERTDRVQVNQSTLLAARCRREIAMAIESEQRVATRAAKLIPVDEVDRIWSAEVAAVRARLLAMPIALADRLHRTATLEGAAGVERELQQAVYQVLTELASGQPPAKTRPRRRRKSPKGPTRTRTATRQGARR